MLITYLTAWKGHIYLHQPNQTGKSPLNNVLNIKKICQLFIKFSPDNTGILPDWTDLHAGRKENTTMNMKYKHLESNKPLAV